MTSQETARRAIARHQARRRLETVMFGFLQRFERAFGALWAHGKPEQGLSEAELEWRRLWAATRKECLDHGHKEGRMLDTELGG